MRVLVCYFNSIKVRLNLNTYHISFAVVRFQFHKGTIKPSSHLWQYCCVPDFNSIKVRLNLVLLSMVITSSLLFQFHKGTIKPFFQLSIVHRHTHFNSIKVRLNPFNGERIVWGCQFQFHKGTIKPW